MPLLRRPLSADVAVAALRAGAASARAAAPIRGTARSRCFSPGATLRGRRLLHFAPEPLFDPVFDRLPGVERDHRRPLRPRRPRARHHRMELPDGSFDLILCSHVLEHVPDDRAAMSELHRVLAPGGLALVLTPYRPDVPHL